MKEFLMGIAVNYGFQVVVSILCFGLIVAFRKFEKLAIIREMIYKIFVIVEKAIPDNAGNKTALKCDMALKLFLSMYSSAFDGSPDEGLIALAQKMWGVIAKETKIAK